MPVADGTFQVELTPQQPDDPTSEIGRMSIRKTFDGALRAESVGQMLSVMTAVEGSAGYVAIERVTGTLADRSGSFALQHFGVMSEGEGDLRVTVVPDSGTDGLVGLTGEMSIVVTDDGHRYTFEYSID